MGYGKRFLSLLLALVFCLSLMPVSVWAEEDAQPVPAQEEAVLAEEEASPAEETAEPEETPAEESAAEAEEAPFEEPAAETEALPAEEIAVETEEAALEGEPAVLTIAPGDASFFRLSNGDDRTLTFFALPGGVYEAFVPAGSGISVPMTATLNGEDVTGEVAFAWDASVPQRNEEGIWEPVPVDGFEFRGQTFSTMDFGEVLEDSLVLHCLATLTAWSGKAMPLFSGGLRTRRRSCTRWRNLIRRTCPQPVAGGLSPTASRRTSAARTWRCRSISRRTAPTAAR